MFSDPTIIIFIGVGGVFFGFLLGYLVRGFFRKAAPPELETETPSPKPTNRHWEAVAQLWRDPRDRRLIFQIENEYYKHSSELTPKERDILLRVVMDFYQWLEPPTPKAPETGVEPATRAPVPILRESAAPKRPNLNPIGALAQAIRADVPTITPPEQSIVAQIDEILQAKLSAADMQKWAVRLVEFPKRGMVVLVGLEQYEGIDAVPYERVRKMIREAVAEWEQGIGPGKSP